MHGPLEQLLRSRKQSSLSPVGLVFETAQYIHSAVQCSRCGHVHAAYSHVTVRWRSGVPLAGLHVCPLSLCSPFVAKFNFSRVCRKGEDMRAFGETIGRHCRLPTRYGYHKYHYSVLFVCAYEVTGSPS